MAVPMEMPSRQVIGDGRGNRSAGMVHRYRRSAGDEMTKCRKWHDGFLRDADGRTGGSIAAPGVRQRVRGQIARHILRHRRAGGGAGAIQHRGARHGLRQLRAGRRAARGADIQLFENLRVLPVLRRHFHDDVVLLRTEGILRCSTPAPGRRRRPAHCRFVFPTIPTATRCRDPRSGRSRVRPAADPYRHR